MALSTLMMCWSLSPAQILIRTMMNSGPVFGRGYGGGQTMGSPFSSPEWIGYKDEDEDRFRSVSIELWETGRLHQPRKFGANPRRLPYIWLETVLSDDQIDSNPAAKLAWEHFQTVAGLTGVRLDQHQE